MDIVADLQELSIPVLIIRGDADPYLSRQIAIDLHKGIPTSKLQLIPTASHFIQEDEPEQLVEAIENFIGHINV